MSVTATFDCMPLTSSARASPTSMAVSGKTAGRSSVYGGSVSIKIVSGYNSVISTGKVSVGEDRGTAGFYLQLLVLPS